MAKTGISLAALAALAAMTPATAQNLLIENVSLLDGTGGDAVAGMWVAVENGRISAVDDAPLEAPSLAPLSWTARAAT